MTEPNKRRLITPIHIKDSPELEWPEGESAFYVLAGNGL